MGVRLVGNGRRTAEFQNELSIAGFGFFRALRDRVARVMDSEMLEEIRKRLKATPFKSFLIRLVDGRKIEVSSPDFVWVPAAGVLHVWNPTDGASDRINPLLIVSVSGDEEWATHE